MAIFWTTPTPMSLRNIKIKDGPLDKKRCAGAIRNNSW